MSIKVHASWQTMEGMCNEPKAQQEGWLHAKGKCFEHGLYLIETHATLSVNCFLG
jgi:hypothetical protein